MKRIHNSQPGMASQNDLDQMLNSCENGDCDAEDIENCARLYIVKIHDRWDSVISREPCLMSWLESELQLETISNWISMHRIPDNEASSPTLKEITNNLLFSRKELRNFILSLDLPESWPLSWRELWPQLADVGVKHDLKVSESVWPPSTEQLSAKIPQNSAATAPQSPSEAVQPLQWTDLGFKFAPKIGVELHDDSLKAAFRITPSEGAIERTVYGNSKLQSSASFVYEFNLTPHTRGRNVTICLANSATNQELLKIKFAGGGREKPLEIVCNGNDTVHRTGSVKSSTVILVMNLKSQLCEIKSNSPESHHNDTPIIGNIPISRPADNEGINFSASSTVDRTTIKVECRKAESSSELVPNEKASDVATLNEKEKCITIQTKLLVQKKFVDVLLNDGVVDDDKVKYDKIVTSIISNFHPCIIADDKLLDLAITKKLPLTIAEILSSISGDSDYHLILPVHSCFLNRFYVNRDAQENLDLGKSIVTERLNELIRLYDFYPLEKFSPPVSDADWRRLVTMVTSKSANIFSFSSEEDDDCTLFSRALIMANGGGELFRFAVELVQTYESKEGPWSREYLLLKSRLLLAEGKHDDARNYLRYYLFLGWHQLLNNPDREDLLDAISALITPEDEKLLKSTSSQVVSETPRNDSQNDVSDATPLKAAELWSRYKTSSGATSAQMDELMGLIAIEEAKHHALQVVKMVRASADLEDVAKIKVTLNFVFYGNPGTGNLTLY